MGYGECEGGGSVLWRVFHRMAQAPGYDCQRDMLQFAAKDPDPKTGYGAKMTVVVDGRFSGVDDRGRAIFEVTLDKQPKKVELFWGEHLSLAPKPVTPPRVLEEPRKKPALLAKPRKKK